MVLVVVGSWWLVRVVGVRDWQFHRAEYEDSRQLSMEINDYKKKLRFVMESLLCEKIRRIVERYFIPAKNCCNVEEVFASTG